MSGCGCRRRPRARDLEPRLRLHHVRGVTFDEDRSQARTGQAPHVMAALRNTVIGILHLADRDNTAAGLRHRARNPDRAITCTLTC